jgi:hypothetical protein
MKPARVIPLGTVASSLGLGREDEWLAHHEACWGAAGVRAIAEHGVSPFAWDVHGDRGLIRDMARERMADIEKARGGK